VRTGSFSPEGYYSAFAPAMATVLWYLAVSIAILRSRFATVSGDQINGGAI
jgi:hypothetical protein